MAQTADGFIRLVLVAPFVKQVRDKGGDPTPALKSMGVDEDMLHDPAKLVHAEIIYGLANSLADAAGDPHLGCHVGGNFDIAVWPPVETASRSAKTVGEFLSRFIQNVPQQASSVQHRLSLTDASATYSVERLVETRNPPRQVEGFGIALQLRVLQMACGANWDPDGITVETAYPEALPKGYLAVRISHADSTGLSIHFPSSLLFLPLQMQAPRLPSQTAPEQLDFSITEALRTAARPLLSDRELGVEDIATALGLEPVHLRRALGTLNTSVPRELKRLRIEVAEDALRTTDRTIAEIGMTLGYSDQSHFARFFRSQTGKSPREFRASADS